MEYTQIIRQSSPFDIFNKWFIQAQKKESVYPNAMTLATVNSQGRPSARIVLLKDFDQYGFIFFTNYNSRKSLDIIQNNYGALCLYWKTIKKSVRIEGKIKKVADSQSDQYFVTRARESKIGAWASKQSNIMDKYSDLEERILYFKNKFQFIQVPRPKYWGGYRLFPDKIEFLSEKKFRLHKRICFTYNEETKKWKLERLFP